MLQSFHEELNKDILEECSVCNERWFNMGISNGICARCCQRDKNTAEDEPELFSKEPYEKSAFLGDLGSALLLLC